MKLNGKIFASALCISLAAGTALAADADKATKQAEIRKAAQASLERFYKANPKLKGDVEKSPGYGVFTTYGFSFIFGGAGGHGLAHDRKTGKDAYMSTFRR
jgi:hypothetical protein